MKNYLILLFLFIGHCVSVQYDYEVEYWPRRLRDKQDLKHDYIIHPCSTRDMKCIREFFSKNAHCKPAYGPIPDPLIIDRMTFPMATSNISSTISHAEIRGFKGKVTSFYINKKTDNLVIAFDVKDTTLSSPRITFIYNRKGKEPIRLTDSFFVTYSSATFTAVIPNIKNLQLDKAYAYAYLDDCDPNYGLAPGLSKSCDPVVLKAYYDLISKIPENAKESLVIQAPNFIKIFIQSEICDFGLKITNRI